MVGARGGRPRGAEIRQTHLDAFDVESYDIKNRYGPEDGEFVTDFTLRADVPRAVIAD